MISLEIISLIILQPVEKIVLEKIKSEFNEKRYEYLISLYDNMNIFWTDRLIAIPEDKLDIALKEMITEFDAVYLESRRIDNKKLEEYDQKFKKELREMGKEELTELMQELNQELKKMGKEEPKEFKELKEMSEEEYNELMQELRKMSEEEYNEIMQ